MKHLMLLTASLMASAVFAHAEQYEARIPFAFKVKGVSAVAGTYTIGLQSNGLTGFKSRMGGFVSLGMRGTHPTSKAVLVFHRYGGDVVLREIQLGVNGKIYFPESKAEREWNALGLQARIETVAVSLARAD